MLANLEQFLHLLPLHMLQIGHDQVRPRQFFPGVGGQEGQAFGPRRPRRFDAPGRIFNDKTFRGEKDLRSGDKVPVQESDGGQKTLRMGLAPGNILRRNQDLKFSLDSRAPEDLNDLASKGPGDNRRIVLLLDELQKFRDTRQKPGTSLNGPPNFLKKGGVFSPNQFPLFFLAEGLAIFLIDRLKTGAVVKPQEPLIVGLLGQVDALSFQDLLKHPKVQRLRIGQDTVKIKEDSSKGGIHNRISPVDNLQDLEFLCPAGGDDLDHIVQLLADQRFGDRRLHRDAPLLHIRLIRADDLVGNLLP